MKRYLPHAGIALGIAIAIYALFFSTSEEDRIRALLDRLEEAVAVHSDESNVVLRGARVKKEFSEIFTQDASFQIPELSQIGEKGGRSEVAAFTAQAPQLWKTATVDLDALEIDIAKGSPSALATGQAHLNATRHNGQLENDTRTVSISMEKLDGNWQITAITVSAAGGE